MNRSPISATFFGCARGAASIRTAIVRHTACTLYIADSAAGCSTLNAQTHCIVQRRALSVRIERGNRNQMCKDDVTNRTRVLYHISHKNLWFPIQTNGLRLRYSRGKKIGVFLVSESYVDWAAQHVARREECSIRDLIIVTVAVRRSWLKRLVWRTNRRGRWVCVQPISAQKIISVEPYSENRATCEQRGLR